MCPQTPAYLKGVGAEHRDAPRSKAGIILHTLFS